ncbi:class I SAM-dependent methyltransferase [Acinetobacter schindleri]|uniref:class I SAM-dependent methyltransferase n=1 Tax=Acinetobacter schindleri TaxID=108981 RepID=UPI003F57E89A
MVVCPLCKSDDNLKIDFINKNDLIYLYKKFTKENFEDLINDDIFLYLCNECKLKFYYPMIIGNEKFYNSLQKKSWYYLDEKEEYYYTQRFINKYDKVLEIGSGKGAFSKIINCAQYVGLDFSRNAKALAEKNGILIHNESIENFSKKNKEKFDVVVNFQVLEHVSNPKSFIENSLEVIKKDGLMIIAVPSESSFLRYVTNGVLNMPPHHVTRWSDETFHYIANKYELKLVDLYHEKLQDIHKNWFIHTILMSLIFKNKLVDISNRRKLISKFTNFFAGFFVKYLRSEILPNGHTVIAVFRKQ